ncbi:30S ribosomal protein S6 [Candidatus Nasuia deltocephalinicola]|uniref:30S ribosomal protein S6 n=1 Tax=Candidatus Nasuia deltocephalincola TaxID=1160784 RepID=UPI00216B4318|nr:30S ribosomal protein S6 [Candidatus Nasuia deltocephalinicola]
MFKIYDLIIIYKFRKKFNFFNFILFLKNIIIYNGCVILNIENWGVLPFYYKIRGFKKGFFLLLKLKIDFFFLKILINYLKSNIFVLRYLLTKIKKNTYFINFFCLKKIKKKNVTKK